LRLLDPDGGRFDLFAALAAQTAAEGEVEVRVDEGVKGAPPLLLRLVIRRKEPHQAQAEQKRLLKDARKRGAQPDPRSLEAAGYILLLASLPAKAFPAADVLALYRFRWQIELAFKRMKSLAGLGELPAKNPELAQAWIYARLIAILLAEQSAGQVPDSPPSGPDKTDRQPVALAAHEDGPRQHPRRRPRPLAMANRPQRIRPPPTPPLRTATPPQKTVRPPEHMLNLALMPLVGVGDSQRSSSTLAIVSRTLNAEGARRSGASG
jgi:hypothetical protein